MGTHFVHVEATDIEATTIPFGFILVLGVFVTYLFYSAVSFILEACLTFVQLAFYHVDFHVAPI